VIEEDPNTERIRELVVQGPSMRSRQSSTLLLRLHMTHSSFGRDGSVSS
jgi:hypothetical protein